MMRSFLFVVALPVLGACGSTNDAALFGASSPKDCRAGTSAECTGKDGCSGQRVCSANGTWAACACGAEQPGASGGAPSSDGSGGAGGVFVASGGAGPGSGGFTAPASGGSASGSGGSGTGGSDDGHSGAGGSSPADASGPPDQLCKASAYSGSLTGPYRASAVLMSTFTAHVEFTVSEKGAIAGTLKGTSDTSSEAALVGTMDCAKNSLSIDITKGSYGSFPVARTYTGTMTGQLDPTVDAIENGAWTITEPGNTTAGGSGTWSAQ